MQPFAGLSPEAFAAYSPEKWSSNVYNLARMKVKEALLGLADAAQRLLGEELAGLDRAASDEVPNITNHKKVDAQWVYWFRDKAAREALASFLDKTPLDEAAIFNIAATDKHAILALVLREKELWVGLRIAPGAAVDRRNLVAILAKAWQRENLLALLSELPDGARMGLEGAEIDVKEARLDWIESLGGELEGHRDAFVLGHTIDAAEAVALGADLSDHVARWLGALAPFYRFAAWSRENDHIDVGRQLQEEKLQKRKQAAGFRVGDKVRVISGLFSGKVGVVQDVDTRAHVRVRVGKMSVVVPGTDLTKAS